MNTNKLTEIFKKHDDFVTKKALQECYDENLRIIKFNLNKFKNYKTNHNEFVIYGAIYDKKSDCYVQTDTTFKYRFHNIQDNEDLIIKKTLKSIYTNIQKYFKTYNSEIFELHLMLIPLEKEFLLIKREIEQYFDSNFLKEQDKKMKDIWEFFSKGNFLFSKIMTIYIVPLFLIILLPTYTFTYLIYYGGFVESIIELVTVSNVTIHVFSYVLGYYLKNILELLAVFVIVLIFIIAMNKFYSNLIIVIILSCCNFINKHTSKNPKTYSLIYEKEELYSSLNQINKILSFNFFSNIVLAFLNIIYIFSLIFVVPQMITSIKNENFSNENLIKALASEYLNYSSFPKLSQITFKNTNTSETVVFVGYDKTFGYYYKTNFITGIIDDFNSKTRELKADKKNKPQIEIIKKKIKTFCSKDIKKFNDIYKNFILGNMNDNSEIIPIKHDEYSINNIDDNMTMKDFTNQICLNNNEGK